VRVPRRGRRPARSLELMPCYRCGRVQTDPVKGASPWAVGVLEREQVLICPVCQQEDGSWADLLDRCPSCGSTRLKMMLGSRVCRACGADS
jgi:Zn finger protein HypA/HybF involved in hydrogenase expression